MTEHDSPAKNDATTVISIQEVYLFSYSASLARGFPAPASDEIACRVVWLEQRGLPGLIALAREFLNNHQVDFRERGMQCPIIAGSNLMEHFEDVISKDPRQPNVIKGPTNGVLLLPKVAQYAEKTGQPIRVSWLMSDPPEIKAQTVIADGKASSYGDPEALLFNTGVGFALHGDDVDEGQGPELSHSEIPKTVFDPFLGFIGRDRAEVAIKVQTILSKDTQTLSLLRNMSDGDRSILESVPSLEADNQVAFMTTPGSENDLLWGRLGLYGWMAPSNEGVPDELEKETTQHVLTEAGRGAMPLLLFALARFPVSEK